MARRIWFCVSCKRAVVIYNGEPAPCIRCGGAQFKSEQPEDELLVELPDPVRAFELTPYDIRLLSQLKIGLEDVQA